MELEHNESIDYLLLQLRHLQYTIFYGLNFW